MVLECLLSKYRQIGKVPEMGINKRKILGEKVKKNHAFVQDKK